MHPEILVANISALADRLVLDLGNRLREAERAGRRFTLVLPGGSVAGAFLPRLAASELGSAAVDFFFADERAVPPSSPESNYGFARRLWFEPARVPPHRVHRMLADDPDPTRAAEAYGRQLEKSAGRPPRLDCVLLGVGADGHVASLFPGHPVLAEERRSVAVVHDAPKAPPRRMTLTLPVLAGAGRVVIAAFGPEKAQALEEAVRDPASTLPVAAVLRRAAGALLLLDPEAGVWV
jgi:6-phosphogluconolactonase